MKLALVYVIGKDREGLSLPLNVLSLASYLVSWKILKKSDIRIFTTDYDDVVSAVARYKPDVVGFSVVTPVYRYSVLLAKQIKKLYNPTILIGGTHISGLPESLRWPFDIGIVGEGERTLAELISRMIQSSPLTIDDLSHINGLVYMDNNKPTLTPMRSLLKSEEIPLIDYSYLPHERRVGYTTIIQNGRARSVKYTGILSARGCPYRCAYCSCQTIWLNRSGLRFYSVKQVGEEIENVSKDLGVDCILFYDDTFAVTKQRLRELINELKNRHLLGKLVFHHIYARANLIDDEFASLLREFGVTSVFLGIESASQRILDYLKNRSQTVQDVKNAIRILNKYQIYVIGSFMLFSPDETMKDISKTLSFIRWFIQQKNTISMYFGITAPYPGTKLWDIYKKQNAVTFDTGTMKWSDANQDYAKFSPSFFRSPLTIARQKKIWDQFHTLRRGLQKKTAKIPNWIEADNGTVQSRALLMNSYLSRLRLKYRWYRFLQSPLKTLFRPFRRPFIVRYILEDIFHSA